MTAVGQGEDRRVSWTAPGRVLLLGLCLGSSVWSGQDPQAGDAVVVETAMLRIIDQVDIPARDDGVLTDLPVREGRLVRAGELLGRLDDRQARIVLQRAEHELQIAARKAGNDVAIRAAVKSREVAETELTRAVEARKSFKESVSQAEIDTLKLKAEKAALDIEQAREDQEVARITRSIREDEVEAAKADLEQRLIVAPWAGMVVQVHKRVGDWMQTGEKVARLVRLDRLRIEGHIDPSDLGRVKLDAPVRFLQTVGKKPVQVEGRIVFISPEVDPVNSQIRVWAEVDNGSLTLSPGQRGRLLIPAAEETTAQRGE